MNGTHQLMVSADDDNMLGDNKTSTINKSAEALLEASTEVSLELSRHRNALLIVNKSFESVAKFKYLGSPVNRSSCIHEEIKCSLNSGNACYHSVQNKRMR
jgi:hypothetical protein